MSSMPPAFGEFGPRGEKPAGSSASAGCATTSPSRTIATIEARTLLRTGSGIVWTVAERTRVQLPAGVGERIEVFLNGVPQRAGQDYRRDGDDLVFERRLAKEGRLGF